MHRIFASLILCLLAAPSWAMCSGTSFLDRLTPAQTSRLDRAADQMPYSEGLIWQATKDERVITVVGTIHIFDERLTAIRDQVAPLVAEADLVMLEATPEDELALQDYLARNPEILFLTDGPTLPEILDEQTWQQVSAAASERGVPGFMAAKMQPWYLSLMLAVPTCAMSDMMNDIRGLDQMIAEQAQAAGVPMQAVEPYTTLFDLLGDSTQDEQIDMMRANMLVPDLQQEMFVSMLDLYFAQEVGKLWELSRTAIQTVPDIDADQAEQMFTQIENSLLITRNRNWMPVIFDAAQTHDRIVLAVGAAHLIDTTGVLQFLADDGWSLTRWDG